MDTLQTTYEKKNDGTILVTTKTVVENTNTYNLENVMREIQTLESEIADRQKKLQEYQEIITNIDDNNTRPNN